jgi:Zn-ribbon-containing, possibly RNA-binding protein and truncated derivatives
MPAKKKPSALGDVLADVMRASGIAARVDQAGIIPEWSTLVGPAIARVTEPQSIAADGTLFVSVTTNAWMMELSMMEPELLRALNAKEGRMPVKKIRWLLKQR